MHKNELESLKPVPQCLVHPDIAETAAAVDAINAAHAVLCAAHTETVNRVLAMPDHDREMKRAQVWREFQAGPLRAFYTARGEAGGRALADVEGELRMMAADAKGREKNIGDALGRLLGDRQAGHDLAVMLMRLTGGVQVDARLQDARLGWHTLVRVSVRLVNDLPAAPVATPAEIEQNAVDGLKSSIEKATTGGSENE